MDPTTNGCASPSEPRSSETLDHKQLRALLGQRVVDVVVVRLIGKWLRAGVLSEGCVSHSTTGTSQGGVLSRLQANIYLHEVLDRWWVEQVDLDCAGPPS